MHRSINLRIAHVQTILFSVIVFPLLTVAAVEDLPSIGVETTVYMGDRMLEQRTGFYDQCLTSRKTLYFRKIESQECLVSSQEFVEKCCSMFPAGTWTIPKGGVLCPIDAESKQKRYREVNFYAYRGVDGSGKEKWGEQFWELREKRKRKSLHYITSELDVVKLPSAEFDEVFSKTWSAVEAKVNKGVTVCALDVLEVLEDTSSLEKLNALDSEGAVEMVNDLEVDTRDIFAGKGEFRYRGLTGADESDASWSGSTRYSFGYGDIKQVGASTLLTGRTEYDDVGPLTLWGDLSFEDAFESSTPYRISKTSLQRSIEYAGKSGEVLTFIYSEYSDGMARDAFTREFTIDISEDTVGAFKGAIFEVLKATNSRITYKVIKHFPN